MQQHQQHQHQQDGSLLLTNPQSSVTRKTRLRGACDFCTKRRRKCDGDGVNRCSLCIAKNQPSCHYSVRLPTGPRRIAKDNVIARSGIPAPGTPARAVHGGLNSTVAGKTMVVSRAGRQGAAAARGCMQGGSGFSPTMVSMKRARLSPSPATGLVGMRENAYIANFFRTIGFLPLASESTIRKAMINTMFNALQRQQCCVGGAGVDDGDRSVLGQCQEGRRGDGAMVARRVGGVAAGGGGSCGSAGGDPDEQASACTLWSTVALGALAQGQPIESVEGYIQLAREALAGCFDCETAQTAKAYTAMALLHNFVGDEAKFDKYIMFAQNIADSLPAGEVPQDLHYTLLFVATCDMFSVDKDRGYKAPRSAFDRSQEASSAALKAPRIFRSTDMCRFLLLTDLKLAQSFFADMKEDGFLEAKDGDAAPPRLGSMSSGISGGVEGTDTGYAGLGQGEARGEFKPPPPGPNSRKFAEETRKEFSLLSDAVDSPEVRYGIGALWFNSIMAYIYVLDGGGDKVACERILRCADVLERNPGLLRFTAWAHLGHCVLAVLADSCSSLEYERMRVAYNSIIDSKMPAAPPLEEWQGMNDICDAIFCRSLHSHVGKIKSHDESNADSTTACAMRETTSAELPCGPSGGAHEGVTTGKNSITASEKRVVPIDCGSPDSECFNSVSAISRGEPGVLLKSTEGVGNINVANDPALSGVWGAGTHNIYFPSIATSVESAGGGSQVRGNAQVETGAARDGGSKTVYDSTEVLIASAGTFGGSTQDSDKVDAAGISNSGHFGLLGGATGGKETNIDVVERTDAAIKPGIELLGAALDVGVLCGEGGGGASGLTDKEANSDSGSFIDAMDVLIDNGYLDSFEAADEGGGRGDGSLSPLPFKQYKVE